MIRHDMECLLDISISANGVGLCCFTAHDPNNEVLFLKSRRYKFAHLAFYGFVRYDKKERDMESSQIPTKMPLGTPSDPICLVGDLLF